MGTPNTQVRTMIEKSVVLGTVVTEARRLMVASLAIAAEDHRAAGIFMAALVGVDRLSLARRSISINDAVRSPFGKKQDQKRRRE
jgi:hypothetical protein